MSHLTLSSHSLLQPLSEMTNIDQMYHLACPTREQYKEDPIQALESCFIGTKNLLDLALRCNARVVLANSSASEDVSHAPPERSPWDSRLRRKRKQATEVVEAVKPPRKRRRTKTKSVPSICKSFYEEGNRLAEMLCSAYEQHFGLEVRIARVSEDHRSPVAQSEGRDGRVLELIASAEDTALDSADATLVGSAAENGVLRGLIDLMAAPSIGKAGSNKAVRPMAPVLLA
jgi:UDP-glucuronate decarboxylase